MSEIKDLAAQLKASISGGNASTPIKVEAKKESVTDSPAVEIKETKSVTNKEDKVTKKGGNKNKVKSNDPQSLKERINDLDNHGEKYVHIRVSNDILSKLQLLNFAENISNQKVIYYALNTFFETEEAKAFLRSSKLKINELE